MLLIKLLNKYSDFLVWVIIIVFSVIYAFMTVNNYRLFETQGWDLAVFDQGIWQWSHFKFPYSSFHDLPWLADHFHLILVTLAPLYWIWSDARVLLIAQAVLVSLGAYPLYLLSKKVTKNNLFSLCLAIGYLGYYSLQWHIFSEFHELTFLPVTLGSLLYFWETKRWKWYWLFLLLTLLVKEEMGLLIAAFAIWEIIVGKKVRRIGVVTLIIGLVVFYVLVYKVMPAIGNQPYRHLGYGTFGNTPGEVLVNILKNPFILIKVFSDSPVKIKTMLTNFWPWAFLPVVSPASLIPVFQQYAIRFLDYAKVIRWTPYFAYSLPIATLTAWGSIYGYKNLEKIFKKGAKQYIFLVTILLPIIILFLTFSEQILLHAPINSIFKRAFYRNEKWMDDNRKILACVPEDVSLSAQNSLAAHLSQRKEINVFPEGLTKKYEYIAVDLHSGQDENNFYFFGSGNTKYVINDIIQRGLYRVVCREGDAYVLKKAADTNGKFNYPFPLDIYEH